jgi:hypothetical protein
MKRITERFHDALGVDKAVAIQAARCDLRALAQQHVEHELFIGPGDHTARVDPISSS